jgi:diguanylate cyclase (GGDEF)-like protein/PAS domain S-box-containing protein
MSTLLQVLIVEDSEDDTLLLLRELRRGGFEVTHERVETHAAMSAALEERTWDAVISDYTMPHFSAPAALHLLREKGLDLPFIIVSGTIGEETAVAAMKAGTHDCIMKDNLRRLVPAIERELREADVRLARQRAEEALQKSEERFQLAVCATNDVIRDMDMATRQVWWGGGFPQTFGLPPEDVVPTIDSWLDRVHPDDRQEVLSSLQSVLDGGGQAWSGEYRFRRGDESYAHVFDRLSIVRGVGGEPVRLVGAMADVTDRKRVEAQLVHLATHDPLTDLLNRRQFQTELMHHLAQVSRYGAPGALVFLDLDQFKDINDRLGHAAGDELLVGLAGVLRERLRKTDLVARLGGDEFAVLLPHTDRHQAGTVAEHLLEAVRRHAVVAGGQSTGLTASIGIVLIPEHGSTVEALMAQTDLALYQAKESGRNCLTVYSPDRDWKAKVEARLGWQQRIRDAVERDLFILDAQPVLHLESNRVSQYELLLRLVDEDGRIIPPGAFLDVAEQSGLIHDVDRWVVRRAIQILSQQKRGGREILLEVNLSAKTFDDGQLLPMIDDELSRAAISPRSLMLEVTETAAIANIHQAQRFVRALKDLGCLFALDDFGVGFSSFYNLKSLPVDYLKIDGSFVRNLMHDRLNQHLVKAMVDVARVLGKETIAEWVGNAETVDLLREYGVGYAQGYFIGHPGGLN